MDSKNDSHSQSGSNEPILCANGCGFFGSPQLNNFCSVCYKSKISSSSTPGPLSPAGTNSSIMLSSSPPIPSSTAGVFNHHPMMNLPSSPTNPLPHLLPQQPLSSNCDIVPGLSVSAPTSNTSKRDDRCGICKKKLRLALRFPCKCGEVFCREHTLASLHNCPFDHKTTAKNSLKQNNPTIMSDKLRDRA